MLAPGLYDLASFYDLVVQPGPCEAFYRAVAAETGGPVLELACGTGRLTIPLAGDGHEVVGLDASPAMLAAARTKADTVGDGLTFVEADMRAFDLGRRFALIVLSCNSLAHMTRTEDLRACLAAVRRHLAPGGLFAFDVVNPDIRALARPETEPVRLDIGPNPSSGIAVEEFAGYDAVEQVRVAYWRVVAPGTGVREIAPLRLRQIFPQELPLILDSAGLKLVDRYGDFDRNPLTGDSLNQICLARGA